MAGGFLSKPSVRQILTTAFWTLFVLIVGLELRQGCQFRDGPLRGTFLDPYLMSEADEDIVLNVLCRIAILAFATVWLVSSHLHGWHTRLWLLILLLELFSLAVPR